MNDRIAVNESVCHGKPVIRGTRVPVAVVLGSLAGGMTYDEVQAEYDIVREDILAVLHFAEEIVEKEQYYTLSN